jgi:hypothetical protein
MRSHLGDEPHAAFVGDDDRSSISGGHFNSSRVDV